MQLLTKYEWVFELDMLGIRKLIQTEPKGGVFQPTKNIRSISALFLNIIIVILLLGKNEVFNVSKMLVKCAKIVENCPQK